MNRSILQKRYALFALITLMLVIALISASCSKQEDAVPDEADEVQGIIKGLHENTIRINRIQGNEELQIDKNQILEIEVATQLR